MRVFLDRLYLKYHRREYLSSDPLEFVHRYTDPWDQEAVALLAALLAYGNVKQIRRSVEDALARIHKSFSSPREYVRAVVEFRAGSTGIFTGFVHRFNRGCDLELLFQLLGRSWMTHGSLGGHFMTYLRAEDSDISGALNRLISDWRAWAGERGESSFRYLLTAPEDGSCCKRWCMFLRWMGRMDSEGNAGSVDPGLWTRQSGLAATFPGGRFLRADQLILPLDTHTGRISQYLGLTERKTLDWRAAVEITAALKRWEPADPTRYDFALARLGILDLCQRRYREMICRECDLLPACRFARAHASVGKRKRTS